MTQDVKTLAIRVSNRGNRPELKALPHIIDKDRRPPFNPIQIEQEVREFFNSQNYKDFHKVICYSVANDQSLWNLFVVKVCLEAGLVLDLKIPNPRSGKFETISYLDIMDMRKTADFLAEKAKNS